MSHTVVTFYVCPLCARDWRGNAPNLTKRVGTFLRQVQFGPGKGVIQLLKAYHARDCAKGGTWLVEVRAAVLALARLLGFELTRETTRQVVRDYTVQQGRRRIRDFEQRATSWARKRRNSGKRAGRSCRGQGGTVAPFMAETWNVEETVGEGGTVAELVKEEW